MMLVPLAVATVFAVQFIHERFRSQRFQLARLDAQTNLYGELFLKLFTSRQLFIDFCRLEGFHYPEDFLPFVDLIETQSNSSLARKYRSFMTDVLGPLQLDVLDLIAKNEAYLQNNEFDHLFDLLVDYVLMASSYKLIFARWKMNDFTIQFSSRRFPPDLIEILRQELITMKEMQARLLGRKVAQQRIKYHVPHYDDHDSSGPTIDEIK